MTGRSAIGPGIGRLKLLGAVVLLLAGVILYVSYTANDGLPLQSTRTVVIEVPNADRLAKRDAVRIGGIRVGQVRDVEPAPPRPGRPPSARITLALDPDAGPLPVDTRVKVRPASILGASYVDVRPGRSGEVVPEGGVLPLERATPTVQATELFDVFDRSTARAMRRGIDGLASATAARGPDLNATIGSFASLLGPLSRVSRVLAAPETRLGGFVRAAATFSSTLEPVAAELAGATTGAARTFGALAAERRALGATIDAAPGALADVRAAMRATGPALDELATASAELRRATTTLPRAVRRLDGVLVAGLPALRRVPAAGRELDPALRAIDRASGRPSTSGVLRRGREALLELGSILEVVTPAQVHCNAGSIWAQNFSAGFGGLGFADGPAIASVALSHLGAQGEFLQNATPSPNVGINNVPNVGEQECEAGNEPYDGRQSIGNPAGLQSRSTLVTRPPAAARERAREAGLLEPVEGGR